MLAEKREAGGDRRWKQLLMLCVLLVITASAKATVPDIDGPRRAPRQELSLQERIETEQLLANLGYWTGPVDGDFDGGSRHALIAFQKVEGRQRTGKLTREELQAMRVAVRPVPRHRDYAHIEIDLTRQVLFIIDATGSITHILPVCTGNEKTYVDHGQTHRAHTPRGTFKVLRKIAGWRRSSLGSLYYPNYIHSGIAIHGSLAVAVYPASHGCVRIPMFAARELSEMTAIGTEVIVYEGELAASHPLNEQAQN
ncbi:MAG TPA: L,D-transpeptidase family protein [Pyrinomonadaceae bacterium]|nr:L,D-transpeptidase family protein [Pyrinomonadaceae bacterium]